MNASGYYGGCSADGSTAFRWEYPRRKPFISVQSTVPLGIRVDLPQLVHELRKC